jgi:hypothetical protein
MYMTWIRDAFFFYIYNHVYNPSMHTFHTLQSASLMVECVKRCEPCQKGLEGPHVAAGVSGSRLPKQFPSSCVIDVQAGPC